MGALRLYLAICVIATHSESVLPFGGYGGREAVQVFYVISGFYMHLVLTSQKYASVAQFYLSRAMRIYPPYLFCLMLVIAISSFWGAFFGNWGSLSFYREQHSFPPAVVVAAFANIALMFQDWVMFLGVSDSGWLAFTSDFQLDSIQLWKFLVIPQSWSVALELEFYLICPLLINYLRNRGLALVLISSVVARLFFYGQFGLNHDPWTYRFLPFELATFSFGIIGGIVYKRFGSLLKVVEQTAQRSRLSRSFGGYMWIVMLVWLVAEACRWSFAHSGRLIAATSPVFREVIYTASLATWGMIIPLLFSLTRNNRIDRFVGELSFPVYLLHVVICTISIDVLRYFQLPTYLWGELSTVVSVLLSVALQCYVFVRVERLRRKATRAVGST
jgi:peptidoglycan/LPS O-acetylase OafA/YrhL